MNSKTKKNKEDEHRTTVRFKTSDYEKLRADMKSQDYTNLSKYVRDKLFDRRTSIKKIPYSGRGIRNGINDFTKQIARIGHNYNQKVKAVNSLIGAKRKNGDTVISTKYLARFEDQSSTLMEEIKEVQQEFIDYIGRSLELVERKIDLVITAGEKVGSLYKEILSSGGTIEIGNVACAVMVKDIIDGSAEATTASEELQALVDEMNMMKKEFE